MVILTSVFLHLEVVMGVKEIMASDSQYKKKIKRVSPDEIFPVSVDSLSNLDKKIEARLADNALITSKVDNIASSIRIR